MDYKVEISLKQLAIMKEIIATAKRKPCITYMGSIRRAARCVGMAMEIKELEERKRNMPIPKDFAEGGFVIGKPHDKIFIDEAEAIINIKPQDDEI